MRLTRREFTALMPGALAGYALPRFQRAGAIDPPARADLTDRKSTRLNSSHIQKSRMPSSA